MISYVRSSEFFRSLLNETVSVFPWISKTYNDEDRPFTAKIVDKEIVFPVNDPKDVFGKNLLFCTCNYY